MLQLSLNWIIVILIFYILYWATRKWLVVNNWLLFLFGIAIFAWGNALRGFLLIAITLIDFLLVKYLFPINRYRKAGLIAGVLLNVGLWLFFKFGPASFFGSSTLSLSLGISFYTLRKISIFTYFYKNPEEREYSFIEYGLYVSFFPQILSGPIEKPAQFIQQIRSEKHLDGEAVFSSVKLIILGLLKKQVIADNLRVIVDRVFQLDPPSRFLALVATIGFALQVFSDFSGYTDISRGFAGLLGYKTSRNFDRPFLATTPREFWNRWHITFTQWLQNHIFFPIRRFLVRKYPDYSKMNLFLPPVLTMMISGIWHGNGWNFILWGLYNGLLIIIYRALQIDTHLQGAQRIKTMCIWLLTSIFLLFGWMLFRAPDPIWIYKMLFFSSWGFSGNPLIVALSLLTQIFMYCIPLVVYRLVLLNKKIAKLGEPIFYAATVVILIMFSLSGLQEFVYFGF